MRHRDALKALQHDQLSGTLAGRRTVSTAKLVER